MILTLYKLLIIDYLLHCISAFLSLRSHVDSSGNSRFCVGQMNITTFYVLKLPFEEINPEDLNTSVMKYVKAVLQLEKGLPPNGVVPILKEKVESMRSKVKVYRITENSFCLPLCLLVSRKMMKNV